MPDTINTPFGGMKKNTAYMVGAGLVFVVGVGYMRSRKNAKASAIAASGANTGIDPATGYPFGSAEDAAALANQGSYITPGGSGGGGTPSGAIPGFTSNAQWAQAAVQYMVSNNIVHDGGLVGAALGKYLAGQHPTSDQASLIQQAIAFQGYPPVAGPLGYPPSVNTSTDPTPTPTPTPATPTGPVYAHVNAGHLVNDWVRTLQMGENESKGIPGNFTFDNLVRLNPEMPSDIAFNGSNAESRFKFTKSYRIY